MIGMWTRIEFYQIHGQDSRSTRRWKKPQRSICGPERDWHEFKQIPDLRMCGLSTRRWKKPQRSICGPERDWHEFKHKPDLRMCGLEVWTKIGKAAQKREKSKNWQTRSQNSIMLAGLEAFISLIRMMAKYSDILNIARRKLELPMDVTMPCKRGPMKRSSFHDFEAKRRESKKKKDSKYKACMCRGGSRVHETTDRIMSTEGKG